MKLFNGYNRRRHPAFPSNEAEAAIEAARQEVATPSEAEKWFASQPTDSRKKEISEWIKTCRNPPAVALLVHRNEKWCAFVLDQKDEEFRGFRVARIFPDQVNACRVFVKRVPRMERHFFSAFHLHHDRPFQNIDESTRVVAMHRVGAAGRIVHGDHGYLLTRNIHQVFGHEIRDLNQIGCLCLKGSGSKQYRTREGVREKAKARVSLHKSSSRY